MALPNDLQQQQDKEIAEAERLSFDFDTFEKDIQTGDVLFMVIRSHLYLEHVLIGLILEACKKPEEMTMRNVNFPTKVDLCIGLGLLDPLWREQLRRIN